MSPPSHISVKLAGYVSEICQPLFTQSNVTAFSFSRIYADGSRAELWSDAKALEHTFFKNTIQDRHTDNYQFEDPRYDCLHFTFFDYPQIFGGKYLHQILSQCVYFKEMQCFVTADQFSDYFDLFIYYAPVGSINTSDIDNSTSLNFLKNFSTTFRINAAALISTADAYRIQPHYPQRDAEDPFCLQQNRDASYTQLEKLTRRETEIASILLTGKTAVEISEQLHISRRTVEHHIENIKDKFHCRKKSELMQFFCTNKL